jgi:hypothetical protein
MAKETTYAGILGDLQRLLAPLEANAAELAHLDGSRTKLATLLAQAQELVKRQAALTAGKQDSSRQLRTLVSETQRLGNALRKMIVEHYGIRSEKLAEFGLQPFRGRIRKPAPEEPQEPEEPGEAETPGAPPPVGTANP